MRYQWDWAAFFQQEIQPPLTLDHTYQGLLTLPFVQGLQVIVTSVPRFAHDQWVNFHNWLADCRQQHHHADYWLLISRLIREGLDDVDHVLDGDIERAAERLQRLLHKRGPAEQFALMACLYHCAQTSTKARMLLTDLLQHGDTGHLDVVLRFYHALTDRQQDVAVLTAHGLTNQEIAEKLVIERSVVAEHLTAIYNRFTEAIEFQPDVRGTRFRLIHWLTRLFAEHPYLLLERDL